MPGYASAGDQLYAIITSHWLHALAWTLQSMCAKPTCVLLSSLTPSTGNAITAARLCSHLTSLGWQARLVDAYQRDPAVTSLELEPASPAAVPDLLIAINAVRCWPAVQTYPATIPFVLVLGGTDVNCAGESAEKQAAVSRALQRACHVVAFSGSLCDALDAFRLPGTGAPPVTCIPQAVGTPDLSDGAGDARQLLRAAAGVPQACPILLLPAGLRPVKDVLWLLPALQAHASAHLVIVGPVLHEQYADAVRAAQAACPRVHVLGPVPRVQLWAWYSQATAVLNTSQSEGQCGAVMEALARGALVIARRNAGNAAICEPACTCWSAGCSASCAGIDWLVDTPEQAMQVLDWAAEHASHAQAVCERAETHAQAHWSLDAELNAWHDVLGHVTPG